MRTSKFRQMRAELLADPEFREEVARERLLMELDVAAARAVSGLTQTAVAIQMGGTQENVSRIERQGDVLVSTLQEFVRAQGGQLEINAVFPGKPPVSLLKPPPTPTSRRGARHALGAAGS